MLGRGGSGDERLLVWTILDSDQQWPVWGEDHGEKHSTWREEQAPRPRVSDEICPFAEQMRCWAAGV